MKIKKSNSNWMSFKDVKIGEVFIDEEEEIAMKIESKFFDERGKYNAVNIETGEFLIISNETDYIVKVLDCELVIK